MSVLTDDAFNGAGSSLVNILAYFSNVHYTTFTLLYLSLNRLFPRLILPCLCQNPERIARQGGPDAYSDIANSQRTYVGSRLSLLVLLALLVNS